MDISRRRGIAFIVVALVLAGTSGCLLFRYLQELENRVGATVDVVAASRDIPARTLITPELLTMETIPRRYFVESYILNPADIVGWVTLLDIREGNYLLREMVDQNAGLGPGERAVSIAVNQVTSVGGNVLPGNRVDVMVSYEDEAGSGVTEMLLQDVEVLAVSTLLPSAEEGGLGPTRFLPTGELISDATVTFALTPQQAMQLTYMSNFATEVRLLIRRLDERETPPLEPVTPRTFR